MARFYQHLDKDENLGKVTQLLYIDDITDEDMTLYYFADGTKCNEEFIAEYNNPTAFESGKYSMVELEDQRNVWTFTKNTITEDELSKKGVRIDENGNRVQVDIPNPYLLDENKNVMTDKLGTHYFATAPHIRNNKSLEKLDGYFLSSNPQLENAQYQQPQTPIQSRPTVIETKPNVQPQTVQPQETQPQVAPQRPIITQPQVVQTQPQPQPQTQYQYAPQQIVSNTNPIQTTVIQTIKHANINMDMDTICANDEYDEFIFTVGGKKYNIPKAKLAELVSNVKEDKEVAVTETEQQQHSIFETPNDYKEDILIKNMIEKSKKVECEIDMTLSIPLPPQAVFETIKMSYSEEMAKDFVTSIAMRVPTASLKQTLAEGLMYYYDKK